MKDMPDTLCATAIFPVDMDAGFRDVALRRMTRLRHALDHAETAEEWRDAALLAFGETRREAERLDYALISDLSRVGLLAARGADTPPHGGRALCRQVAQALSVALDHGATGGGGGSAQILRDRLSRVAPQSDMRCPAGR